MNLLFHQNFCKTFCKKFCIVKKNYQLIKLNLRVRWIVSEKTLGHKKELKS